MTEKATGGFGIGDKVRTTETINRWEGRRECLEKGTVGTIVHRVLAHDDMFVVDFPGRPCLDSLWTGEMELVKKATKRDVRRVLSNELDPDGAVSMAFDALGLPPEWLEEFADFVTSRR
jgi:hypothetical protein